MKPALPALLLGLLASTAALNVNRRDALKGTTASVAQIALPTASLAQVALPAPAVAATEAKLALPKMGIGAWAWGDSLFWGYDPKEDEELEKVFSFVAARKDGFVDTAELYGIGRSETLIGQFEKRHGKVTVASKFAALPWRTSRDDVVKACEASLKRLGRDSMELYQIHFPNAWANEAYWDGLGDQREPIRLTVRENVDGVALPDPNDDAALIPPLDLVLRTKWPGCLVDWNGSEPIL